jgi:hypothetical protein
MGKPGLSDDPASLRLNRSVMPRTRFHGEPVEFPDSVPRRRGLELGLGQLLDRPKGFRSAALRPCRKPGTWLRNLDRPRPHIDHSSR